MYSGRYIAWTCFAALLIHASPSLADENDDTYPGETIAEYLGLEEIVNISDNAAPITDGPVSPANANGSVQRQNNTELLGRDSGPVPWKPSPVAWKPSLYRPAQSAISATYNNSDGQGYNITLPGCTLADSVLGDWQSPSGDVIDNCTLAQMSKKLKLPTAMLLNLTSSRAQRLVAKINSTLQGSICEAPLAGPDRELKAKSRPGFRFDPATQTAYFSSLLLIGGGAFGITWTGLHLGIIHEGITANITLPIEVLILASFASVGTVLTVIAERERRHIGHAEAVVLNAFIFACEKLYDAFGSGIQCLQEGTLLQNLQNLGQRLSQGTQVFMKEDIQATAMKTAGMSRANLVSLGDIESQVQNGHCGK